MPTNNEPYVLHTWQQKQTDWHAPTVTGGEGAWFWDESGQRYLDLSAQAQCNHLGHQHPDLVAAIQRQAGELCFIHNAWARGRAPSWPSASSRRAGWPAARSSSPPAAPNPPSTPSRWRAGSPAGARSSAATAPTTAPPATPSPSAATTATGARWPRPTWCTPCRPTATAAPSARATRPATCAAPSTSPS